MQAFARGSFAGAPTSALQYQGFCANVTSCQIVTSGLSTTYNYTLAVFASTAATVAFDLSLTCVNNVDPLAVVVYATLPPQRYSGLPVSNTPCYSFFAQSVRAGDTFNTFLLPAPGFKRWAQNPRAASNITASFTCTNDSGNFVYMQLC